MRDTGPVDVRPHDPALLETSRAQWLAGDWAVLGRLPLDALAHHPDRGRLALLSAAARLQLGHRIGARACALQAVEWGCDRAFVGRVLLAGLFNTLGRASMAAGREPRASRHFERAVTAGQLSAEIRRLSEGRRDAVAGELGSGRTTAAAQRKAGLGGVARPRPAWLTELADRCLDADDVHESVDQSMAKLVTAPDDRVQFGIALAERFQARRDPLTALHFLNVARESIDAADPSLRNELARGLVAAGRAAEAVDLVVEQALAGGAGQGPETPLADTLMQAYRKTRATVQSREEHGHELLLAHLREHLPAWRTQAGGRRPTLVEIGTTRENVPGQGSTRKLAEYCREQGLHFVTVDMDPHNTGMAQQLFERLGVGFEAVTMKGEDYLRRGDAPLDFVFLDAYDFDHGKHSELRQSRYRKFLGASIDEAQCHQMHLECAESVVARLSALGVVCIDDTWLEDGRWAAKGTLAMPYLLDQGFVLLEARNRAALLRRGGPVPERR